MKRMHFAVLHLVVRPCSGRAGWHTAKMTDRVEATDANTSFSRNGGSWSEITALSDIDYRVRLGGMLSATWMVGLCSGLARERVSIDRAHARRLSHDGSWIAELHVFALPGARDPLQFPLIAFADQELVETAGPLSLQEYSLVDTTDHGGTLRLHFSAPDSVGLLASLLAAFASLSLLPVEMHIETQNSQARDCLWLASSSGKRPAKPSDVDRRALDLLLRRSILS